MGLISRVSSRTYRYSFSYLFKMTNTQAGNITGFHPRKCTSSGRLIGVKDHASIQLNIAEVDENGHSTGSNIRYAICGELRRMGESDDAINRLCRNDNIIPADKW